MSPRDDATEAQVRAAMPDTSTWLAANAGSGKTRVLTDRVARLLLDGVQPQHVLCLTYTKAAASEMQNRLFRRLGDWAMLEAGKLRAALEELGVDGAIDAARLRDARRLFARAIETPGGLKIQTIHSFCSGLLRRFPLEAGVSPQFTEIEDRAAALLRAEVLDAMAEGADAEALAGLAAYFDSDDLSGLTAEIVGHAETFAEPLSASQANAFFGLADAFGSDDLAALAFTGEEAALLHRFLPAMQTRGGEDAKRAAKLAAIRQFDIAALPVLEGIFLTGAGAKAPFTAKIGTVPTKAVQQQFPDDMPALDAFMLRIEAARAVRLGLQAARRTAALHRFAARFLARYSAEKAARGWLDFDDLITRTRQLLTDPAVAAWVLYRIDGGIDHILVDEAQDTSPAQWDVIRKLAAEFSSGEGVERAQRRTIFVVGDKKQSIYSFQGADPREFDRMETEFREKLEQAGEPFQSQSLAYSFRSSQAVLRLVDETFKRQRDAGFADDSHHIAFKEDLPGRVDLWPVIAPQQKDDDRDWDDPLDRQSDTHHTVQLAHRIAAHIKALVNPANGVTIPESGETRGSYHRRAIRPGDFLILFQGRKLRSQNSLFASVIRALKEHDLPVAGADRLRVGAELAVRDLCALLSFLALPEDSLALASALKSPLFGWDEADLYRRAQGRGDRHLWQILRAEDGAATRILKDLRAQVDFLRPYDLLERILTRHQGRRKILARLGPEAEDGINALLAQALAYERTAVPSLTGFLVWMETDDLVIKRQVDSASDQIRVMTVHGAKGLEAPIVILPDCGPQQAPPGGQIVPIDGTPVWKSRTGEMPPKMAETVDALKDDAAQERLRLLYVALTRAEKWLIVAAAGDLPKNGQSWYQQAEAAFAHLPEVDAAEFGLSFRRYAFADWDALPLVTARHETSAKAELPAYFYQAAPPPAMTRAVVSPSDLGGAKALPGEEGLAEDAAKSYGSLVHDLLDRLGGVPRDARGTVIEALRRDGGVYLDDALGEVLPVIDAPDLSFLFVPEVLSEVSLSANLGSVRLHGVADRVIVARDCVTVVDFKTNRRAPASPSECPEGLLRQMGAYVHALAQIYPDRRIEAALLWTGTGRLMALPHETVTRALERTLYLDDTGTVP